MNVWNWTLGLSSRSLLLVNFNNTKIKQNWHVLNPFINKDRWVGTTFLFRKLTMCALDIACLGWENWGFGAWKEGGNHPGWRKGAGNAERPRNGRDPCRQMSWNAQGLDQQYSRLVSEQLQSINKQDFLLNLSIQQWSIWWEGKSRSNMFLHWGWFIGVWDNQVKALILLGS